MNEKIKRSADETEKILKLAKKRYKKAQKAWSENYRNALDKLRFFNGKQWSDKDEQNRKDAKRPALVLNEQPRFALKVCGELRKNKVQIKVSPVDNKGNQTSANVRAGIIKNIECMSNGESVYDRGNKMMVISGFGAARVLSRYSNDPKDPFKQELYIQNIDNPFAWIMDPDSKDHFFSDAEYCFGDTPMEKEEFIDLYGENKLPPEKNPGSDGTTDEHWYDEQKVIIREYFFKEYTTKTMVQLSDGQILEKDEAKKFIDGIKTTFVKAKKDQEEKKSAAFGVGLPYLEQPIDDAAIPEIVKEREVEEPKIRWMKITATEILEENEWPGSLIPIAFLTGEYINIGGKKWYYGMFQNAEDCQKMVNHAYTNLWEVIGLMPKTPMMASAKMVEGYEEDYLSSSTENFPLLKYKFDKDFPGMIPTKLEPGQMPAALFTMFQSCKNDMKDMVGMYNTDLGDEGKEISGKAIIERQRTGEDSMYTFVDNATGYVAHIGKIINEALGYYYDTERDERLRGADGKGSFEPINTTAGNAANAIKKDPMKYQGMKKGPLNRLLKDKGPAAPFNNITEGHYDLIISTGPAYHTQRQEAAENILKIAQLAGRMNPADLWHLVNSVDAPGMEEWAQTIAKRVPPGMIPSKEGEEQAPPPPPSPQAQFMMGKVQLEQMKMQTEKIKLQLEMVKLQNELSQSKGEMKNIALQTVDEMFSEHHPADKPQGME